MALLVGDVVTNFVARIDKVADAINGVQDRLDGLSKQTFAVKFGVEDSKAVRAIQRIDLNLTKIRVQLDGLTKAATAFSARTVGAVVRAASTTDGVIGSTAASTRKSLKAVADQGSKTGEVVGVSIRNASQAWLDWTGLLTAASLVAFPGAVRGFLSLVTGSQNAGRSLNDATGAFDDINFGAQALSENLAQLSLALFGVRDVFKVVGDTLTNFAIDAVNLVNNVLTNTGNTLSNIVDTLFPFIRQLRESVDLTQTLNSVGTRLLRQVTAVAVASTALLGVSFALRSIVSRVRSLAATRPDTLVGRLASLLDTMFIAVNNLVSPVVVLANRMAAITAIMSTMSGAIIGVVTGVSSLFIGLSAVTGLVAVVTPLLANMFLRIRTNFFRLAALLGDGRARFLIFFTEVREAFGSIATEFNAMRKTFGRRFNFVGFLVQAFNSIRTSVERLAHIGTALVSLLLDAANWTTKTASNVSITVDRATLLPRIMYETGKQAKGAAAAVEAQQSVINKTFGAMAASVNAFWETVTRLVPNALVAPFLFFQARVVSIFNTVKVVLLGLPKFMQPFTAQIGAMFGRLFPEAVHSFFGVFSKTARSAFALFTTNTKDLGEKFREIWKPNTTALDAQFQKAGLRLEELKFKEKDLSTEIENRIAAEQERARQAQADAEALGKRQEALNQALKSARTIIAETPNKIKEEQKKLALTQDRVQVMQRENTLLRQLAKETDPDKKRDIQKQLVQLKSAEVKEVQRLKKAHEGLEAAERKGKEIAEERDRVAQKRTDEQRRVKALTEVVQKLEEARSKFESDKGTSGAAARFKNTVKELQDRMADISKQMGGLPNKMAAFASADKRRSVDQYLSSVKSVEASYRRISLMLDTTIAREGQLTASLGKQQGVIDKHAARVTDATKALDNITAARREELAAQVRSLGATSREQHSLINTLNKRIEEAKQIESSSERELALLKVKAEAHRLTSLAVVESVGHNIAALQREGEARRVALDNEKKALEERQRLLSATVAAGLRKDEQFTASPEFRKSINQKLFQGTAEDINSLFNTVASNIQGYAEQTAERTVSTARKSLAVLESDLKKFSSVVRKTIDEALGTSKGKGGGSGVANMNEAIMTGNLPAFIKTQLTGSISNITRLSEGLFALFPGPFRSMLEKMGIDARRQGVGHAVEYFEPWFQKLEQFHDVVNRQAILLKSSLESISGAAVPKGGLRPLRQGLAMLAGVQLYEPEKLDSQIQKFTEQLTSKMASTEAKAAVAVAIRRLLQPIPDALPSSPPKDAASPLHAVPEKARNVVSELAGPLRHGASEIEQAVHAMLSPIPREVQETTETLRGRLDRKLFTEWFVFDPLILSKETAAVEGSVLGFFNRLADHIEKRSLAGLVAGLGQAFTYLGDQVAQGTARLFGFDKATQDVGRQVGVVTAAIAAAASVGFGFPLALPIIFASVATVISTFEGLTKTMSGSFDVVAGSIETVSGLATGVLPAVATGFGLAVLTANPFVGLLGVLLVRFDRVAAAVRGFGKVITGIVKVGHGVIQFFNGLGRTLFQTGRFAFNAASIGLSAMATGVEKFFEFVAAPQEHIFAGFKLVGRTAQATADRLFTVFKGSGQKSTEIFGTLGKDLQKAFNDMPRKVTNTMSVVAENIQRTLKSGAPVEESRKYVELLVETVVNDMKTAGKPAGEIAKAVAKIGTTIAKSLENATPDVKAAMGTITEEAIAKYLPSSPPKAGPLKGDRLPRAGRQIVSLLASGILDGGKEAITALSTVLTGAFGALKGTFTTALGLGQIIQGVIQTIRLNPAGLITAFKGVFNTLKGMLQVGSALLAPMRLAGRTMMNLISTGMSAGQSLLTGIMSRVLKRGVKDQLPASPPLAGPLAGNFLGEAGGRIIEMLSLGILKSGGRLNTAVKLVLTSAFMPILGPASVIMHGGRALISLIQNITNQLTNLSQNAVIGPLKQISDSVLEVGLAARRFAPSDAQRDEFVGKFDAFVRAVKPLGIEASRVETIFVTLQRTLAEVSENELSEQAAKFQSLGVDLSKYIAGQEDLIDVTLRLSDAVHSGNLTEAERQQALELTSATFGPLANLIQEGGDKIRKSMAEARASGMLLNDKDVQSAVDFNKQISTFEFSLESIKRTIFQEFVPPVTAFLDRVQSWWKVNKESVLQGIRIISRIVNIVFDVVLTKIHEWTMDSKKFWTDFSFLAELAFGVVLDLFNEFLNKLPEIIPQVGRIIRALGPVVELLFEYITTVVFPKLFNVARRLGHDLGEALFGRSFLRKAQQTVSNIVDRMTSVFGPDVQRLREQANIARAELIRKKFLVPLQEKENKLLKERNALMEHIKLSEAIGDTKNLKESQQELSKVLSELEHVGDGIHGVQQQIDAALNRALDPFETNDETIRQKFNKQMEAEDKVIQDRAAALASKMSSAVQKSAEEIRPELHNLAGIALDAFTNLGGKLQERLGNLAQQFGVEKDAARIRELVAEFNQLLTEGLKEAEANGDSAAAAEIEKTRDAVQRQVRALELNHALLRKFSTTVDELRRKTNELLDLEFIDLSTMNAERERTLQDIHKGLGDLEEIRRDMIRQREAIANQVATSQVTFAEAAPKLHELDQAIRRTTEDISRMNFQMAQFHRMSADSGDLKIFEAVTSAFVGGDTKLGHALEKIQEARKGALQLEVNLEQAGQAISRELEAGSGPVLRTLEDLKNAAVKLGGEFGASIDSLFIKFTAAKAAGQIEEATKIAQELLTRLHKQGLEETEAKEDTRFDALADALGNSVKDSLSQAITEFSENEGKVQVGRLFNSLFKSISDALLNNLINDMTKELTNSLKGAFKEVFSFAGEQAGAIASVAVAAVAVVLQFLTKQANDEIAVAKEGLESVVEETERVRGIISGESTIKLKEVADNLREALVPTNDILRRIEFNTRIGVPQAGNPGLLNQVGGA